MRDVFLSYAHEDEDRARELSAALEAAGYTVWRDRLIVAGENWREKIETAIREARSVVVIWSPSAVASGWVMEEATLAREQGKLVPAMAEEVEIPLSFRLIQTADLRDWDTGVQSVVAGVAAIVQKAPASDPVKPRRVRRRVAALAWLLLPTLVIALVAAVAMAIRLPATVEIDVAASSFRFRTAGSEPQVLLESAEAASLVLTGFQSIRLTPASVWMADTARYDLHTDTYPDSAWRPLTTKGDLVLLPVERADGAAVLIKPWKGADRPLGLGTMFVSAGEGTLSSPEKGLLSVQLRGDRQGTVTLPELFEIRANYCQVSDVTGWDPSVTLRARLPAQSRYLEYSANNLDLQVRRAGTSAQPLFGTEGLAVSQLVFSQLGRFGAQETTLMGDGSIRIEGAGSAPPIALRAGDWLGLEDLRDFRVKGSWADGQFRLRLSGTAGTLRSTSASNRLEDRRVSLFDSVARNAKLAALFAVVVWLVRRVWAGKD